MHVLHGRICLIIKKLFSPIRQSQYRFVTTVSNINLDEIIKNLYKNYKNEFDELTKREQTTLNDNQINRLAFLKSTIRSMKRRDELVNDINETQKLFNGKSIDEAVHTVKQ